MALNGRALAAIGVGSLFVWSGVKGWSLIGTVGDIVVGNKPQQSEVIPLIVQDATQIALAEGGGVGTGATGSANSLANSALQYKGHCYKYGGAPGLNGQNCWDCSSMVNWVASRLGLAIPGYGPGKYDGSSHGPPTGAWGVWPGLKSVSRAEVQAGDIIVWTAHMGIALSNNSMISALNERDRTVVSAIDGYGNGPLMKYGRY